MGERKVLNKYYPIDFDPKLIPKKVMPKNKQFKIRMELPMSVRCDKCGEYMYKGKRFNARKEDVEGELYLGLRIFRFYMKCTRCSGEFTIKTDPENTDYTCEHGVSRNFEPLKEEKEWKEAEQKRKLEMEMGDTMAQLESKTIDTAQEMEDLDRLDEMRAHNARASKISADDIIGSLDAVKDAERKKEAKMTAEERQALEQFRAATKKPEVTIKRIDETSMSSTSTTGLFSRGGMMTRGAARGATRGRGLRARGVIKKRRTGTTPSSSSSSS